MQYFGRIFRIHQLIFISIILFLLDSQPPLECMTSLWNKSVKYNSKILVKHLFICNFMMVVSCLSPLTSGEQPISSSESYLIIDCHQLKIVKYEYSVRRKHLFICNFMTVVSCLWVAFRSEVCWVSVGGKACAC